MALRKRVLRGGVGHLATGVRCLSAARLRGVNAFTEIALVDGGKRRRIRFCGQRNVSIGCGKLRRSRLPRFEVLDDERVEVEQLSTSFANEGSLPLSAFLAHRARHRNRERLGFPPWICGMKKALRPRLSFAE